MSFLNAFFSDGNPNAWCSISALTAKWFRKAAEQGLAKAQATLAEAYYCGRGVEKSPEEAVKWYLRAADQGDFKAQEFLRIHREDDLSLFGTFAFFGITLEAPCALSVRENPKPIMKGTHLVDLPEPFRHFAEAEVRLTQTQKLVESLTLRCRLPPTQAADELAAIRHALEKRFDVTFKDMGRFDFCHHGLHWDAAAYIKNESGLSLVATLYLKGDADGTVALHVERPVRYLDPCAVFIRDVDLSRQ